MRYLLFLSIFSVAAIACGSGGSGTPDGGTGGGADGGACASSATGTLQINVTGLPGGVDAHVQVTGPDGPQTVNATKTITPATSGDYTVTATTVAEPDPIVRKAYKATVSAASAKVCDGQSASVDVTFSLIPTSNKVWWGSTNSPSDTLGYPSSALAATGSPDASIATTTAGTLPGAFDKDGNLWVIDTTAGSVGIKRYPADTLASSGAKTPDITVSSDELIGGVPGPASIAFDPGGNLWVGVLYSQKVIELDAPHLVATGSVTPKVEISNVPAPNALAFDVKGNLWVGSSDNVLEYGVSRLAASTSDPPDVTIASQTPQPVVGPLTSVLGLAFTANDELWVNYDGTLAKLTSLEIGTGGASTITPAIQIKADVLSLPAGLAFDESGGLWMAYSAGKFCKFGAGQLGASGSIAPEVIVTSSSVGSATSPAFFPAPASVPLYSSVK